MFRKKFYSILHNCCPRCHHGKLWPRNNPYYNLLFNGGRMFDSCSHCGLKYYREIGFWYGAMYVSYALGIAEFLFFWLLTYLALPADISTWFQVGIIAGAILLLTPANYFYSRLVWINLFVKYEEKIAGSASLNAEPQMSNAT